MLRPHLCCSFWEVPSLPVEGSWKADLEEAPVAAGLWPPVLALMLTLPGDSYFSGNHSLEPSKF